MLAVESKLRCQMESNYVLRWHLSLSVPSSAPWNVNVSNFHSESAVSIEWTNPPPQDWHGRPFGITLYYRIVRKGTTRKLDDKANEVRLRFDQTRYRVSGLDINWALSFYLVAQTMGGGGPSSAKITGGESLYI